MPLFYLQVDLKRLFNTSPWEKTHIYYNNYLDMVRFLVAWLPIIFSFVQLVNWVLGLEQTVTNVGKFSPVSLSQTLIFFALMQWFNPLKYKFDQLLCHLFTRLQKVCRRYQCTVCIMFHHVLLHSMLILFVTKEWELIALKYYQLVSLNILSFIKPGLFGLTHKKSGVKTEFLIVFKGLCGRRHSQRP